jgi:four helix bundle protein
MAPFERFKAWQLCHALVLEIYRFTCTWPAAERYGLVSQLRRAAVSVPTNLAEGVAKRGSREFRRFLDISLGSLSELTYLLRLSHDLGYLGPEDYERIERMREEAGQVTWGLYRAISRKAT